MKLTKRILSLLLVLAMVLSVLPLTLFASADEPVERSYVKVTSTDDLVDGWYLIVNEESAVAFNGKRATLDGTSNTVAVVIADNTIASTETIGKAAFKFTKETGSFLGQGGKYCGRASSRNGLDSSTTEVNNTVSINEEGNADIIGTGGCYLRYNANSGQTRFRYYTAATYTGQKPIALYKLVGAETPVDPPYNPEKPAENVAPKATPTSTYCASWSSVLGVNDGSIPASSNGTYNEAYGSYGTNADNNPEDITLTWNIEVSLKGAGLFFWSDQDDPHNEAGINFPASYTFEYLDADGVTWKPVENTDGLRVYDDIVCVTLFDTITTKGLRVLMNKSNTGSFGLGVAEFEAYGELLGVDTVPLENAITNAEAIDLANYTDETAAALTEALAAAKAVLAKEDKTQDEIDAAAAALEAAIAALKIKPVEKPAEDNIAPQGTASAEYCANWNNVAGVNDGDIPAQSNGDQAGAYGSWGQNNSANPEPITITFEKEAEITGAGMYFWTNQSDPFNKNGINFPASYSFEYLDGEEWKPVANAKGMNNEADVVNYTVFDKVTTTALRVVMNKASTGSFGLGVAEFEIYGSFAGANEDLTGKTVILHTNDIHGAIMGYAQVAALKAEYAAKGANVILVDAGDYSQGTIYVSTNKGAAAVEMMNAAGYDFATLGNHEFDFGYAQLVSNMEKAEFKPIVADVLLKETGKSIFDGHAIKEVGGVKIGFFGMETPETFTKVNPGLIQEITFPQAAEMYACAQAEVDALKEEGADIIIGLVHLGVDPESEPNRSIDLFANVTGIDFLIDGHSHTVMTEGPNGEPIQSTGTKASETSLMNVGLVQIDNETKKIEKNELIPITAESALDETVAAKAQAIMDEIDAAYNEVFARTEVKLNGDRAPGNRTEETNLGDLITDAMVWGVVKEGGLTVDEDHVVGITNGGGIRATIDIGDVTMKMVNTVLPFGNTVAVVYVTGAELLEALEASTYCTPTAVGGFPQVSGIKFNIDITKEFDQGEQYPDSTYYAPKSIQRVTIDEINGKPFDPAATYAVVTNNFCAAGGDTYYAFKAASSQFDTSLPMDEVLMDYIKTKLEGVVGSDYAEPQGRITFEQRFTPPFEAIGSLAKLTDGKYIISLWRYLGADNAEGYIFYSQNAGDKLAVWESYDALSNDNLADEDFWEIKKVDGGYTIQNVGTGKYLGDAVPAASDDPVVHKIVEGECAGVHDYAIGNSAGTGSLRYSNSSKSFSFNTTAPETEVTRAWAANVLLHVVEVYPAALDTSALEAAIEAAKAVEAEKYTEESVAALNEALAAAEAVLAKEDATQEEIDAAAKTLNDAIAALVEKPVEPEVPTYELVTDLSSFNAEDQYVITLWRYFAGTNDDTYKGYVFGSTANCGGVRADTADNYATITYNEGAYPAEALWSIVPVEGGYALKNVGTGKYLGNAVPAASDEAVALLIVSGELNGVTNYGIGYDDNHRLRYSGSSDSFSWNSGSLASAPTTSNACNVLFYKVVTGGETPAEPVQLFAGSDIQGSADWNKHLDNIAKNAKDAGHEIDVSFWCGDYADGSVYADGSDTSHTETPERIQYIKDTLNTYWPELSDFHFAQGNHDGSEHIGTVIDVTGPKEYDDFVLYQINEDDFPWWQAGYMTYSSEDTCLEKINATTAALGAYLDDLIAKEDQRVIFIYTHVPLHWTSRTTTANSWWSDNIHADILFNMINEKAEKLDIVFLYGHNHSENYADAYPDGGSVNFFAPGDTIRIPNGQVAASGNYTEETIKFTYLNAGYVGKVATGFVPNDSTASVITLYPDKVEFTRYNDNGHYEGSDRTLIRNNRGEYPAYLNLNSVENPKVRKEGDTEHFQAVLKNAEAASYTWSVEGSGEVSEGQGTDTAAITYTGGGEVVVKVVVTYVDSKGETQTLEQTKTVEVKAAPAQGEITYNEVKSIADLAAGKQYAIVVWRYFGGSNDDTFNGYGFGATNAPAYRAPTDDNYETIKPEAELTDDQLWEIVPVEGGVTLKNIGTGKYLAEAIPAAADEAYTLTIAEGECNGVYNMAIGTASGSIRYSNSSGTFAYSSTTPSGEVGRAYAANITIYEKVVPAKVYPNIAPQGTASSDFCASWSSVAGVNDEVIPDSSNPGYDYNEAYGSWGKNSNSAPETILITFEQPAKLYGAGAFFWYNADGPHNQNGIDIPASYIWEYQNAAGEWVEFPNAAGYGIEEDIMNQTTFDPVLATVVRINMAKSTTGSYGLGVAELELYGELVEPVDTAALEAAIAAAEAIEDLDAYTEDSVAALTEALAAAKAELENIDKTQESVDAAAEALNAAIAALKEKPLPNIAPEAINVEAPYCASWNNLAGVNDGVIPSASNTAGDNTAYGSWRSNGTADPELITFTFEKPAEIRGASSYFLYNENSPHEQYGIDFPDAYTYEYLNAAGEWVEVPNALGYGLEEDILNQTSFDAIVTTAFRIVMQRQAGSFGLGVGEIEIYGQYVTEYIDKSELAANIAEAEALTESDWTPESWAPLAEALAAGKEVYANPDATQEEVDAAAKAIRDAIDALVDKVQAVIDLIEAIEEPYGLEDEEAIEAAREAYDALTEEEQARVDNYSELLLAEVAYYEALIAKYKEDKDKYEEEIAKALADAKEAAIKALEEYAAHAELDHDEEHVAAAEEALAAAIEAINAAEDSEALRAAVDAGLAAIDEALKGGEIDNPDDPFRFEDVKDETKYYFEPVYWAYNHDPQITAGTSDTKFSPLDDCTRGQVVTFLWRAAGTPEPTSENNPFTDVTGGFYYKAVLWAVEKEITAGTTPTTFNPSGKCTRGQVVTFLYRFAGKPATTAENPFTDVVSGAYYYDAVLWAVANEVTSGTTPTTFNPNGTCNRAQVVTFLYRYMNKD